MRLVELFLNETTEEDRALISLASAISDYVNNNFADDDEAESHDYDEYDDDYGMSSDIHGEEDSPVLIGTIGQLFDTPLEVMNPIKIELQSDYGLRQRRKKESGSQVIKKPGQEDVMGLWYGDDVQLMVLNKDYLGTPELKSVVVHELRHALDDYKSDFKANKEDGRYSMAKKKSYRKITNDPIYGDTRYLAEPAEINARFVQVLNRIVDQIPPLAKFPKDQLTIRAQRLLKRAMDTYRISYLFPEKEKSKDYKRLLKRGMDFIMKELSHAQGQK